MLCQNCKKNTATVFCKENINGRILEYALCPECASVLRQNSPFSLFDDDPFGSLFSGLMSHHKVMQDEKKCPLCNSSFKELAASGKVGCPTCYETFAAELSPTVHQLHGSVKSCGRAPRRYGEKRERETKLARLRAELQSAINAQEFEKAAELRDQIRAMEAK